MHKLVTKSFRDLSWFQQVDKSQGDVQMIKWEDKEKTFLTLFYYR